MSLGYVQAATPMPFEGAWPLYLYQMTGLAEMYLGYLDIQIKYNKQLYSHNVEHFSKLCIYTWNVTWNLGDGVVLASAHEIL